MIICVCNNVSEKRIRQAIGMGATSVQALTEQLDVGSCCGQCQGCVHAILDEELGYAVCPSPHVGVNIVPGRVSDAPLRFVRSSVSTLPATEAG